MPFKEIMELRKNGQLDAALTMGLEDYENHPQDLWIQSALGWVYYSYMKQAFQRNDTAAVLDYMTELVALPVMNDVQQGEMLRINVCRFVEDILKSATTQINASYWINDLCDSYYNVLKGISFSVPGVDYSTYLSVFLPVSELWNGFVSFCDDWNFDNLRPEDYQKRQVFNSTKTYTGIAECAFLAYSKALIKSKNIEKIKLFQPKLDVVAEAHPEMEFVGYYNAKLLLELQTNDEDVVQEVLPFLRKHVLQPWVWEFMAEIYEDEPQKMLACLLRACSVGRKELFLLKIRFKIVQIYLKQHDISRAKWHLDKYIRCRMDNGYSIPYNVQNFISQEAYVNAKVDKSDAVDFMAITNEILGPDFKLPVKEKCKKGVLKGVVTANKTKTTFFVKGEYDGLTISAFIPSTLSSSVSVGDNVQAEIYEAFNKARKENGWKCKTIKKI